MSLFIKRAPIVRLCHPEYCVNCKAKTETSHNPHVDFRFCMVCGTNKDVVDKGLVLAAITLEDELNEPADKAFEAQCEVIAKDMGVSVGAVKKAVLDSWGL
jgi:hypothetical protein